MSLAVLLLHAALAAARLLHSLPDDAYAFPKYRIAFLNGLPVPNHTAHRWLTHGLRGGFPEFLDQPSHDDSWLSTRKEIGTADMPLSPSTANYTLEHMKIGPRDAYICLIPNPPDVNPSTVDDDAAAGVSPARSWSLLQPLTGTCLYVCFFLYCPRSLHHPLTFFFFAVIKHRQGWFTYSYCHNREIRQFKELNQANPLYFAGKLIHPVKDRLHVSSAGLKFFRVFICHTSTFT